MESKYTVVGDFRQPHKDCEGDTLTDLSYKDAVRIESEWEKEKKYKKVFHFKQELPCRQGDCSPATAQGFRGDR